MQSVLLSLKGTFLYLLGAALLFCFMGFILRDVFANGTDPLYLYPYKELIFWSLITYTFLITLAFAFYVLVLAYRKAADEIAGTVLGYCIALVYIAYFFERYREFFAVPAG